jgi:hypothetical protein
VKMHGSIQTVVGVSLSLMSSAASIGLPDRLVMAVEKQSTIRLL